jgi:aryl-alcohol dehydrogenase-like predicted oxidoreductase
MTYINDTKTYAQRFKHLSYNELGTTGLYISQAAFGGYRVSKEIEEHYDALKSALENGINIIDTSSNYTDGDSERLVGQVVADLITTRDITREEVVIVTKAGYLQGENFKKSQQRKKEGIPFKELVEYSDALEHCIHPQFLDDQIDRSLRHLNVTSIDVFLLHNPEYFLLSEQNNNKAKNEAQQEYYRRIGMAFQFLEEQVKKGRIKHYGISSNTFITSSNDYTFTDLNKLMEIAESINLNHNFKVIQCPMNLAETEAATARHHENHTLLEYAKNKGIGVLINRPLNAVVNQNLIRLVDYWVDEDVSMIEIDDMVTELAHFEASGHDLSFDNILPDPNKEKEILAFFNVGQSLMEGWTAFKDIEQWKEVMAQSIVPRIEFGISTISGAGQLSPEQESWLGEFIRQVNHLLKSITLYYKADSSNRSETIKSDLRKLFPEFNDIHQLSHSAINFLRMTNGVSSVLVGMRQLDYVDDVLCALEKKTTPTIQKEDWKKISTVLNKRRINHAI